MALTHIYDALHGENSLLIIVGLFASQAITETNTNMVHEAICDKKKMGAFKSATSISKPHTK